MSCPAVVASGPAWPQPVMRAKISRGLTAAQSSGPMPSRSQVPGRKQSSSTSALAAKLQQHVGFGLDVEVDDSFAPMHQVDILGRHLQRSLVPVASLARIRPAHPHHVGTQIRENHPRVRSRPDTAEFDDLHPGQGTRIRHAR